MAEVYEVATFYHHFDVVKEGEAAPPARHGARVRDALVPHGRRAAAARQASRPRRAERARDRARPASAAAPRRPRCASARTRSATRPRSTSPKRVKAKQTRRRRRRTRITLDEYVAAGRLQDLGRVRLAASASSRPSSRRWRTRACAAWAARASPPGASGASCAPSRARGSWRSTSTRASPARSRTATTSSATRTASSRAC